MDYQKWSSDLSYAYYVISAFAIVVGALAVRFTVLDARQAKQQIELIRGKNLELERLVSPRDITPDQRANFAEELKSIPVPQSIRILQFDDVEAMRYAMRIGSAFGVAGWEPTFVDAKSHGFSGGWPPDAVRLLTPDAKRPRTVAIQAAFSKAGFPLASTSIDPSLKAEEVIVGLKPEPTKH